MSVVVAAVLGSRRTNGWAVRYYFESDTFVAAVDRLMRENTTQYSILSFLSSLLQILSYVSTIISLKYSIQLLNE